MHIVRLLGCVQHARRPLLRVDFKGVRVVTPPTPFMDGRPLPDAWNSALSFVGGPRLGALTPLRPTLASLAATKPQSFVKSAPGSRLPFAVVGLQRWGVEEAPQPAAPTVPGAPPPHPWSPSGRGSSCSKSRTTAACGSSRAPPATPR